MRRLDAEIIAQQFENRLIGGRVPVRPDPRFIDADIALPAALGEFEAEPALAASGIADDADDARLAVAGIGKLGLQRFELRRAADQRTEPRLVAEDHAGRG